MGRRPIGQKAMTPAETQKRYRLRLKHKQRLAKGAIKRQRRNAREVAMAERIRTAESTLKQGTLYGVIYADPPWRFEPYSRETGMDRAADNHYPTMTLDDIENLAVPAAKDCVLFLWATGAMMPAALQVMARWGFEYKSQIMWAKDRIGTGYWARSQHEVLLIGVRGDVPAPAPGTQAPSIIHAPRGRHSEKPTAFAEMIEGMFPNVPKLEMFAREARVGWDVWGAEVNE